MRWHRLAAVARKEIIQVKRDPRSLFIVVAMPIAMMVLFGYGVSLDLKHTPVCALDHERTQRSEDLLERFAASQYFAVIAQFDTQRELTAAIDDGRCKLGLVIPQDFSRRLSAGGTVGVQALVDATDDNTANLIFSYTEAVIGNFANEVRHEWLGSKGNAALESPLRVDARTWFNEALESKAFIVPGVVALVMAVIGTFLSSLTIAREWERGTMEQLISTPVTSVEVMVGKLAPYFAIGMFNVAFCAGLGIGWFEVPFRGSLGTLFLSSALFLVVVLGLGYFISVIAKTQLAASQIALVATFMPAFLLSGFLFAIDQMPALIRAFTYIVPARYYVAILKNVFLKGSSLELLSHDLAALAVFAVAIGALATRVFHKRLG